MKYLCSRHHVEWGWGMQNKEAIIPAQKELGLRRICMCLFLGLHHKLSGLKQQTFILS